MSFGRIKLRPTDILFSKYIRAKMKFICERCKKWYENGNGLQASHFWGRHNESTRFSSKNIDCFCAGCHQYFTANPGEYTEWKKKKLGLKEYKLLELEKNLPKKRDDKMDMIIIKELMKSL